MSTTNETQPTVWVNSLVRTCFLTFSLDRKRICILPSVILSWLKETEGGLGGGVLQRTAEEERRWIRRKTMTMTCMKSEERKKERKDGSDEASKKATKLKSNKTEERKLKKE